MSKYIELFNYLRQCPQLANLWSIIATNTAGESVILPQGTSSRTRLSESVDILGRYDYEFTPLPSVYEEFQINCFRPYAVDDGSPSDSYNVLQLDDVQAICDWITEQNDNGNLPQLTGKQVISIECNPFNPQIRGINAQTNTIAYYITVRIRYVNPLLDRR